MDTLAAWRDRVATAACVAVVVHYRDTAETLGCVAALREHAPNVPVLVVDNDGTAAPQEALLALHAEDGSSALLVTGENRGFGTGCNRGIDAVLAAADNSDSTSHSLEHILLLNPDARPTPGMVEQLRRTATLHGAGIVGGTVLAADGQQVQFANGRLRPWTLSRTHCKAPSTDTPFETTFVTGALMLIDTAMLRAGLRFDERFFLYVEDVDLCCEVRKRGRSLWIDPRAIALHRGGGCQGDATTVLGSLTADQVYWMARSKVLFSRKRATLLQRCVHLLLATAIKPLAGLIVARSTRFLAPHYRGVRDGLRPVAGGAVL